jgi:hypothetical protein
MFIAIDSADASLVAIAESILSFGVEASAGENLAKSG